MKHGAMILVTSAIVALVAGCVEIGVQPVKAPPAVAPPAAATAPTASPPRSVVRSKSSGSVNKVPAKTPIKAGGENSGEKGGDGGDPDDGGGGWNG